MKITALASWFGSNRLCAEKVGDLIKGCSHVAVVFSGGMSEIAHIDAPTILVNDKHRHVINLARVMQSKREQLCHALSAEPFHPDVLAEAQDRCKYYESLPEFGKTSDFEAAKHYFICCWMGRSGNAGTDAEFSGGLSLRWDAGGGDSNTRYRSAIESAGEWEALMKRCTFSVLDFREFLKKCKDKKQNAIYSDAPFPDAGAKYKHKFSEQDQRDLADLLGEYEQTRVVIRFYDHPLIRELYPTEFWKWYEFPGRKQTNEAAPEVLITRY